MMHRIPKKESFIFLCLALVVILVACTGNTPGASTLTRPSTGVEAPDSATSSAPAPSGSAPATSAGPAGAGEVASRFDQERAMEDVRVLSRPEFMGRHSGTSGETLGAQYLSEQFQLVGLMPAGDNGTYVQEFPMTVTEFSSVPELTLIDSSGGLRALQLRDDFRPLIGGDAGPGSAEGPGVFAGTGDFSNVDVDGKVAVVVPRQRLGQLVVSARDAGALALVLTTGQETLTKGENQEPNASGTLPVFLASTRGVESLLEGSGHTREDINAKLRAGETVPVFPLAFTLRLDAQVETYPILAKNVIALLPAAVQTQDVCIVGAHYEEIGPDPDGVVYPAANDNASGTAVMLEMARILAEHSPAPRANVLFIGWSGHEEGLIGSAYYLDNPVFPVSETECYINLDTVGQGGGQELLASTSHSRLREAMEAGLAELESVTGQKPPVQLAQRSSGASDHINFENRGVETIDFNWTGIFEGGNIHVPEDDANNVDPEKIKITGQVATATLLNLVGPR